MRTQHIKHALVALTLSLTTAFHTAQAQSEASLVLSALPVASVVGAGATLIAVPAALAVSGAVLVVKAVQVGAYSTVYVLERASDGARVSVELSGRAASGAVLSVGASVAVTAIAAGVVLSASGELLCFLPNALGQALLHNERLSP